MLRVIKTILQDTDSLPAEPGENSRQFGTARRGTFSISGSQFILASEKFYIGNRRSGF